MKDFKRTDIHPYIYSNGDVSYKVVYNYENKNDYYILVCNKWYKLNAFCNIFNSKFRKDLKFIKKLHIAFTYGSKSEILSKDEEDFIHRCKLENSKISGRI